MFVPGRFETLAEKLKEHGFLTTAWNLNVNLSGKDGFAQGFDKWHSIIPRDSIKGSLEDLIRTVRKRYRKSNRPEFHYIHTMDVHLPYLPPAPFDIMWVEGPYTGNSFREGSFRDQDNKIIRSNLPYYSQRHNLGIADIDYGISQYDGAILYTDTLLPRVLHVFDYDPARDIVIISADHGEQFFEHNFWGHGQHLYPEEIHVPLIIHYEGVVPGPRLEAVSLLDIYPTVCDIFGIEPPAGLRGRSLLGNLSGEAESARFVYSESIDQKGPHACVLSKEYYYGLQTDISRLYPWRTWPYQEKLFLLDADPLCKQDVKATNSKLADELNQLLRKTNPRYAAFDRSAIQGDDDQVLSSAAMPDGWRVISRPSSRRFGPLEVGSRYILELRYVLRSGMLRFQLRDEKEPSVSWEHVVQDVDPAEQKIQVIVYPKWPFLGLSAMLSIRGEGSIEGFELYHAVSPNLKTVPLVSEPETEMWPRRITAQEILHLETLGYLKD